MHFLCILRYAKLEFFVFGTVFLQENRPTIENLPQSTEGNSV